MASLVPRVLAAFLLLSLAGVEAFHDATGRVWPGFAQVADVIGILLVPTFVAGAVCAFFNRPRLWGVTAVAAGFAVVHGFIVRLGDSALGIAFVSGGLLALIFVGVAAASGPRYRRVVQPLAWA
jgi:hypothetical protein